MRVDDRNYRTIFVADDGRGVVVIDQTRLPFEFMLHELRTSGDAADAIRRMVVRGAPLIGVTAAYGVALAMQADSSDDALRDAVALLGSTRPTAVNLHWALSRMMAALRDVPRELRAEQAYAEAARIADEDVTACAAIGRHGRRVLDALAARNEFPAGNPVL